MFIALCAVTEDSDLCSLYIAICGTHDQHCVVDRDQSVENAYLMQSAWPCDAKWRRVPQRTLRGAFFAITHTRKLKLKLEEQPSMNIQVNDDNTASF